LRAVANGSLLDFPPSILADLVEQVASLREQPFQRILLFTFIDFIDPLSPCFDGLEAVQDSFKFMSSDH